MFELEERYAPEIVIKPQLSDSTAQKFQKRIEKIMEFPSECEWNRFKELNAKIDETAVLQKANRELPNIDSIFRQIDLMLDLPSVTTDIDALVSNIEQTKSNVFDNFKKGCYILVKNLGGLYFSPEKKEDLRISAKNFYLMSENGSLWSAIHFENAVKIIDERKEFFLYNDYSSFVFRVNKNNGPDTIALLDIMMPVRVVRIAGMKNVYVPINVMEMHIKNMEAESADREQKIKDAEEQLQRTYKGIVFKSGIEKEEVIKEEAEIQQFCQTLDQKNFEELWNKKKMLSKMPNAIFAPYITKLILAMDVQENKEKDDYLTEIEIADINFLSAIQTRLDRQHYSDINKNIITDALKKRKLQCQRDVLESIVKSIDTCSREALKEMLHEVQSGDFEDTLAAEYTSIINRQSTLLDTKELRQLCANVPYTRHVPELKAQDYKFVTEPDETAEQDIIHIMMQKYRLFENDRGKIPAVRYFLQEGWESVEAKVCKNFGIINERKIVMYYDRSQHGTASEGFAIGLDYIHIKQPMAILFSEYYFYLNAFIVERNETNKYIHKYDYPAIFRIDRIKKYRETGEKFQVSYTNRFEEGEFRKRIQFMYAGQLMNIQLKFYGENPEPVLDRLPTAQITEQNGCEYLIRAEVYGKGIIMWLLSQGNKIEVIRPESLRQDMKKQLEAMLEFYK